MAVGMSTEFLWTREGVGLDVLLFQCSVEVNRRLISSF